ncbi:ubiquitin-like protein Pup [Streptomyces sp. ISL-96]|uniref:ubiquitin-like protein Pup n=1 Tax=Streptomyces sp. ISL-96 TaxID=2819191 RepID=UPI001BEA5CC6|nr:ubiquitin-like protein Pup [Streptomyces sp. ISL-96]MBT2487742.1 ubiquitin-like protein Pup [Streptomyces sp. ISL-96]
MANTFLPLGEQLRTLFVESFRLPSGSPSEILRVYERRLWVFALAIWASGLLAAVVAGGVSSISGSAGAGGVFFLMVVVNFFAWWGIFKFGYLRASGRDSQSERIAKAVTLGPPLLSPTSLRASAVDLDRVFEEIESILHEDEEQFVREFVQQGGQGWSGFLEPSFFIGMASFGVASGMSWRDFMHAVRRFLIALSGVPGPANTEVFLDEDGEIKADFVEMLHEEWFRAEVISRGMPFDHSAEDSIAFHWVMFARDFLKSQCLVRLSVEQYSVIELEAASSVEGWGPSELVQRIIDRWISEQRSNGL